MTPVHPSAAPGVVSLGESNGRFTSRRGERLGSTVLLLLVVVLAVVIFNTSNNTIKNIEALSDSGGVTSNIHVAERESLVFVISFERWLSGTITRRDLQIRRALLAQRLAVRDNVGVTNGTRFSSGI